MIWASVIAWRPPGLTGSGGQQLGTLLIAKECGARTPGVRLEVVLHLGTMLAVLAYYRRRLAALLAGMARGERTAWGTAGLLLLSMVPAALVLWACGERLDALFADTRLAATVAAAMLWVTGLLLLSIGLARRADGETVSPAQAWWIGCLQAVAILPGISSPGSTITAARTWAAAEKAAEFSFLMSVPIFDCRRGRRLSTRPFGRGFRRPRRGALRGRRRHCGRGRLCCDRRVGPVVVPRALPGVRRLLLRRGNGCPAVVAAGALKGATVRQAPCGSRRWPPGRPCPCRARSAEWRKGLPPAASAAPKAAPGGDSPAGGALRRRAGRVRAADQEAGRIVFHNGRGAVGADGDDRLAQGHGFAQDASKGSSAVGWTSRSVACSTSRTSRPVPASASSPPGRGARPARERCAVAGVFAQEVAAGDGEVDAGVGLGDQARHGEKQVVPLPGDEVRDHGDERGAGRDAAGVARLGWVAGREARQIDAVHDAGQPAARRTMQEFGKHRVDRLGVRHDAVGALRDAEQQAAGKTQIAQHGRRRDSPRPGHHDPSEAIELAWMTSGANARAALPQRDACARPGEAAQAIPRIQPRPVTGNCLDRDLRFFQRLVERTLWHRRQHGNALFRQLSRQFKEAPLCPSQHRHSLDQQYTHVEPVLLQILCPFSILLSLANLPDFGKREKKGNAIARRCSRSRRPRPGRGGARWPRSPTRLQRKRGEGAAPPPLQRWSP